MKSKNVLGFGTVAVIGFVLFSLFSLVGSLAYGASQDIESVRMFSFVFTMIFGFVGLMVAIMMSVAMYKWIGGISMGSGGQRQQNYIDVDANYQDRGRPAMLTAGASMPLPATRSRFVNFQQDALIDESDV